VVDAVSAGADDATPRRPCVSPGAAADARADADRDGAARDGISSSVGESTTITSSVGWSASNPRVGRSAKRGWRRARVDRSVGRSASRQRRDCRRYADKAGDDVGRGTTSGGGHAGRRVFFIFFWRVRGRHASISTPPRPRVEAGRRHGATGGAAWDDESGAVDAASGTTEAPDPGG
jgi:hypothetical protein